MHSSSPETASGSGIRLVGFDADDTLWRSEDYFAAAQGEFERIVGGYIDLDNVRARERLLAIEKGNLALFGYGVKGMALSMIEAAVDITAQRISASDLHAIVAIAKDMLRHPVELLPDVREAVEAVAREHAVVLITKGDLFHQEAKVRQSGLADLFGRIEIVSEKDDATYHRVLGEFNLTPAQFCMVGNSLRSDIAPVLRLGGWAVHVPYHLTWEHEREAEIDPALQGRWRELAGLDGLPAAVRSLHAIASAQA
ncbi:HAD family hydrolase [Luteimonas yindakuii]|uniref:HAD family hydrolase n=1 Tax=Luteimonas yindakuii TaxID=2565782 RepID=A0A4Z1R1W1_9GAMM|nr:HAD family hydrolase [Luteimonas yindakuii]TKS52926.1 HAD family hydrolase [Luteimonas yindakuii]